MVNAKLKKVFDFYMDHVKKLYWIAVTILFSYIMWGIIDNLTDAFNASSITFTMNTLFLNWNTSFPSVTVCQVLNGEKIFDLSERYYGEDRDGRLDDYINDIAFFSGTCYSCELCENDIECPSDFHDILQKFRAPCRDVLTNCTWNGMPFECCTGFLDLQTEFGTCFSINSANTHPSFAKRLISNRRYGPGKLTISAAEDVQIHIHPPHEIPFFFEDREYKETIFWGSSKEIIVKVVEIENDPSIKSFSIENRHCRFPQEKRAQDLYNVYSFSTCSTMCMIEAQMTHCQCIHHLMPQNSKFINPICNFTGLICLTENFADISDMRKHCRCLDSCVEPNYAIIYKSNDEFVEDRGSLISVSMMQLPHEKLVRRVVKSQLDYLISVGGIVGLFFGASILSTIDLFYHNILKSLTSQLIWLIKVCMKLKKK